MKEGVIEKGMVKTGRFRVSFPKLMKAEAYGEGKPKFSVVGLFAKDDPTLKILKTLAAQVVADKWPDPKKRPKNLRNPFRDGDEEKPDLDGYPGHTFITFSSEKKPGVFDKDLSPIEDDDTMYAGCYAKAVVSAYAYGGPGTSWTPGVAFGLRSIMKVAEGESFGAGRVNAEDHFSSDDAEGLDAGTGGGATIEDAETDSMFG